MQAPPKAAEVEVDGVQTLKLSERVTLLRGICNDRFKFEVEYGLKRGTSDNCYVVRVRVHPRTLRTSLAALKSSMTFALIGKLCHPRLDLTADISSASAGEGRRGAHRCPR